MDVVISNGYFHIFMTEHSIPLSHGVNKLPFVNQYEITTEIILLNSSTGTNYVFNEHEGQGLFGQYVIPFKSLPCCSYALIMSLMSMKMRINLFHMQHHLRTCYVTTITQVSVIYVMCLMGCLLKHTTICVSCLLSLWLKSRLHSRGSCQTPWHNRASQNRVKTPLIG